MACSTGVLDWPLDRIGPVPDVPLEVDTGCEDGNVMPYDVALALGLCWSRSDHPPEDWERTI